MSDDYTPVGMRLPDTQTMRDAYALYLTDGGADAPAAAAEFDRWLDAHDVDVAATALRDAVPPEWNEDDHRGRTDGDNSRWDWLSGQWVERYGHRIADSVREIARFSHSMEIWFTDDLLGEPDPDALGVES